MLIQIGHILGLGEDEFLAGPERYALFLEGDLAEDLMVIDDVFAKTVPQILTDYPCQLADLSAPSLSIIS